MTDHKSFIVLGKQYRDKRFGITGYATRIDFEEHGCVLVGLAYNKAKEGDAPDVELHYTNALRLAPLSEDDVPHPGVYASPIEFGVQYEDIQTGIKGYPSTIEFHEDMADRVTLRTPATDKDGNATVKYLSIDTFLLKRVGETETVVAKTEKDRSPHTHEVARR